MLKNQELRVPGFVPVPEGPPVWARGAKARLKRTIQRTFGVDGYLAMHRRVQMAAASRLAVALAAPLAERFSDLTFIRGCLQPGDIAVDVGANVGVYAAAMARCVGVCGRVYAFEPVSLNFKTLENAVPRRLRHTLVAEQLVLSDQPGVRKLELPTYDGTFYPGYCSVIDASVQGVASETITAVRLDEYFRDKPGRIRLMKIDVENHELEVLRGAQQVLREHRPLVLCELWDNHKLLPVFELFERLGYVPYILDGAVPMPLDKQRPGWRSHLDYVFLPRQS